MPNDHKVTLVWTISEPPYKKLRPVTYKPSSGGAVPQLLQCEWRPGGSGSPHSDAERRGQGEAGELHSCSELVLLGESKIPKLSQDNYDEDLPNNRQAATAAAAEAVRENGQSSTASHVVEYGTAAGTTSQGENRFLGLIQGWQHRRASGYYLLTDACGDVITEYQEARHVRLAGCNVTDCTVELLDREADDIMISKKMTSSSSSSTWCNVPVTQSADPITSLMGHLRCLASL
ncbi:hypothetical protein PG999_011221 [Apiospora kogelbergensis]|uniref:Uncharacterized protein n=1 Tax=Apiospora kogelbergensis TaxID=1337665 RepID=A0AAW0QDL7_9PEZI